MELFIVNIGRVVHAQAFEIVVIKVFIPVVENSTETEFLLDQILLKPLEDILFSCIQKWHLRQPGNYPHQHTRLLNRGVKGS